MKKLKKDKDDIEYELNEDGDIIKTEEMKNYEDETGKYAVWRGIITEGFRNWKEGKKVYDRDKERISLYVSEETKQNWADFVDSSDYSTISKLIRDSVDFFIEKKSKLIDKDILNLDSQTVSNLSHALKEPLTTIKGFSQLLIENYKDDLSDNVLSTIKNIFEQSILLENKIVSILDDIKVETPQYDILLIEDDLPTIRLITSFFEGKGYSCKGVVSGKKGLEELNNFTPKIILLDIILPDYNGYDLCTMIKSDVNFKDIPLYYLTAIPGSEVEKKLEETKADSYILKPFDLSDFEIILDKL